MNRFLPALDLLTHNAIAVLVAIALCVLVTQVGVVLVLRVAAKVLALSAFEGVSKEDRAAFRRGVQRRALRFVLVLGAVLLVGAVVASYRGLRALDQGKAAVAWFLEQDFAALKRRLLSVVGILVGAGLLDGIARSLIAAVGKGLAAWKRLEAYKKALPEVVEHLRIAVRAVVVCATLVIVGTTIELPAALQRPMTLLADVTAAFYTSRALSTVWHVVTDVLAAMSGRLSKLEGPLKVLSNLKNLTGITRRVGDYLIYVGAATLVAGQVATDAWYYGAGQIGLRLIVIFYASRVLVEVCILLVHEFFLGKPEDHTEGDLQRRRTLLPVVLGFLRYGIYFTGLIMGLKEASVDPTPLLAGAGVLGVAIGFGAQTFVGDIVAGFFILFEDLVLVGDLVEVGGIKGNVEEIGVRITRIRDDSGVLHSIPNGEVRKVANHSREHVNAVVDVYVPYEEDLRRVRGMLETLTETFLEEQGTKRGDIEVKVEELSEAAIQLRIIARVPPGADEDMSDGLRGRVVEALQSAKVGAPRPRRAVIIDSALRVVAPPGVFVGEEDAGPPEPFKPAEPDA